MSTEKPRADPSVGSAVDMGRTMVDPPSVDRAHARPPVRPSPKVAPAPPAHFEGMRIRQYEIIRELGRGGMGHVLLARDTKLGRRVAIKFLSHPSPEAAERSLAEARATAACVHENIVVVHEADVHEG